ncbi:hypothetical protein EVAR_56949_1 [Eumeta japonica]|uniref:Uncharacterized protein n=1 Tax=Eumeta variegata TaxID=151549 RepID=A0A4C1YQE6_EUMVA|nr:hypothetical protein EVAR_56949_1 [Eumeta japonica]
MCMGAIREWSSLPMDTRNLRTVTVVLPASLVGIRYRVERVNRGVNVFILCEGVIQRRGVDYPKSHSLDSGSCYFSSVFCEGMVSNRWSRPIFMLHPS